MHIKPVILFFIFSFMLLSMQNGWSIDCEHAQKKWELAVCDSETLTNLDQQMNKEYKLCMKLHKEIVSIKSSQKYWLRTLDSIDADDSSVLEEAFSSRLSTLRTWIFSSQRVHSIGPVIHQDVPYRWIRESLHNEILLNYPMLVASNNQTIKVINSQINDLAKEYLKEAFSAYDCQGGANPESKFDVFGFSVTASKANLFGINIEFDPCYCGCAHSDANVNINYLWDLGNGENIQRILDTPLKIKDDNLPEFWKKLAEYNHMYLGELSKKESCEIDFIKEFRPAMSLTENSIVIDTRGTSGAERFCGDVYTVPYLKYKAVNLKLNPDFIHYLPRFVKAGLISESIAKELTG
jgi:uncharacterized protein YecT (DUF1311 family)